MTSSLKIETVWELMEGETTSFFTKLIKKVENRK